jgi:hypothetical protein
MHPHPCEQVWLATCHTPGTTSTQLHNPEHGGRVVVVPEQFGGDPFGRPPPLFMHGVLAVEAPHSGGHAGG